MTASTFAPSAQPLTRNRGRIVCAPTLEIRHRCRACGKEGLLSQPGETMQATLETILTIHRDHGCSDRCCLVVREWGDALTVEVVPQSLYDGEML
jgi:hypothetical protein